MKSGKICKRINGIKIGKGEVKHCFFQDTINMHNKKFKKSHGLESSGQDGGVGRNPSFPHTIKRRKTTNLKSINNQKCQKIKIHGTPTITELKKQREQPDW